VIDAATGRRLMRLRRKARSGRDSYGHVLGIVVRTYLSLGRAMRAQKTGGRRKAARHG